MGKLSIDERIKAVKDWREMALDASPPPSLDKSMRRRWYDAQRQKIETHTKELDKLYKELESKDGN
tara:strand:- start:145 stop:342 length:198 start_codon:yes stop_codon:yes gene_type:complete